MNLDVFLATVLRLATGIMAIQEQGTPVKFEDAVSWATAAAYHAEQAGLDPFELIAVARNESNFTPRAVGKDGKDCGITQTRITYSKYSCNKLRNDTWIAFAEAARELKHFDDFCKKRSPKDRHRCRLNSYNQGYKYKKTGRKGAYYARVACFAESARLGIKPNGNCRLARGPRDVARIASIPAAAPETTTVATTEPSTQKR